MTRHFCCGGGGWDSQALHRRERDAPPLAASLGTRACAGAHVVGTDSSKDLALIKLRDASGL
ncbi:hypothetical protein EF914_29750, partial [Streptomyces sp. WAC05458]